MTLSLEQRRAKLHLAIDQLSDEALAAIEPSLETAHQSVGIRAVFLQRAIRALTTIAEGVPLAGVTAAPSDYDLLLELLRQPEVKQILPSSDPLAAAKLRGLLMKRELLTKEGGVVNSEEAAQILGISRQAVDKRRNAHKLIALPMGRSYVYPVWQFDSSRAVVLPGLEAVLHKLGIQEPWMQTAWFLADNARLEGQSPLIALREGQLQAVRIAASLYGEQGAV